ncbi:hypothetical protein TURU_014458 [Turdus rufiventris]|nr:hypothetical protein TURU_014458 [Turdus rufiventris]
MQTPSYFTERGVNEGMNTALKLEEGASLQDTNPQNTDNPQNTNRELVPYPSGTKAIPKMKTKNPSRDILTDWDEIRRKALKEGDFDMASTKLMAMPVSYGRRNVNPKWAPLTQDITKDLRQAMKESGLGSPYFKQLLKCTSINYYLVHFDLRYITMTILTDAQFMLWEVKWKRALTKLRESCARGPHRKLAMDQLAREAPHDKPYD